MNNGDEQLPVCGDTCSWCSLHFQIRKASIGEDEYYNIGTRYDIFDIT